MQMYPVYSRFNYINHELGLAMCQPYIGSATSLSGTHASPCSLKYMTSIVNNPTKAISGAYLEPGPQNLYWLY